MSKERGGSRYPLQDIYAIMGAPEYVSCQEVRRRGPLAESFDGIFAR